MDYFTPGHIWQWAVHLSLGSTPAIFLQSMSMKTDTKDVKNMLLSEAQQAADTTAVGVDSLLRFAANDFTSLPLLSRHAMFNRGSASQQLDEADASCVGAACLKRCQQGR
jgi:hypothetical protein